MHLPGKGHSSFFLKLQVSGVLLFSLLMILLLCVLMMVSSAIVCLDDGLLLLCGVLMMVSLILCVLMMVYIYGIYMVYLLTICSPFALCIAHCSQFEHSGDFTMQSKQCVRAQPASQVQELP